MPHDSEVSKIERLRIDSSIHRKDAEQTKFGGGDIGRRESRFVGIEAGALNVIVVGGDVDVGWAGGIRGVGGSGGCGDGESERGF